MMLVVVVKVLFIIWLIGWGLETCSVIYNIKKWYRELLAQSENNYSYIHEVVIGSFLEATLRLLVIILIKSLWPFRVWCYILNQSPY
jgi:hypothetical protein